MNEVETHPLLHGLSLLCDGWAGPFSRRVAEPVLRDISEVARSIPPQIDRPTIEIYAEGYEVVLFWTTADHSERFSLSFIGTGRVVGAHIREKPWHSIVWRMSVTDREEISRMMATLPSALLSGKPAVAKH